MQSHSHGRHPNQTVCSYELCVRVTAWLMNVCATCKLTAHALSELETRVSEGLRSGPGGRGFLLHPEHVTEKVKAKRKAQSAKRDMNRHVMKMKTHTLSDFLHVSFHITLCALLSLFSVTCSVSGDGLM